MTAILSVDTVAMHRQAQRIRQATAGAAFGGADHEALQPAIAALAAPILVQAVRTFVERWTVTLADLVDDAHRLADAIDLVADAYREADTLTGNRLP